MPSTGMNIYKAFMNIHKNMFLKKWMEYCGSKMLSLNHKRLTLVWWMTSGIFFVYRLFRNHECFNVFCAQNDNIACLLKNGFLSVSFKYLFFLYTFMHVAFKRMLQLLLRIHILHFFYFLRDFTGWNWMYCGALIF